MKRIILVCGIAAMLFAFCYPPAKATAILPQSEQARIHELARKIVKAVVVQEQKLHAVRIGYTCGSVCEDRMEQAVISCLQNGGDETFCFMAAKAIYCQCQYNECGVRDANGCGLILP